MAFRQGLRDLRYVEGQSVAVAESGVAPLGPRADGRLLAAHSLRATDALQVAAAPIWCDEAARGDTFVCLDERLTEAARREGFALPPV